MKKILVSILLILALLAFTTPAAAGQKVPVGEKLNIYFGVPEPIYFTAGAPFHVNHGWLPFVSSKAIGIYAFKLEIDGVFQKVDYVDRSMNLGDPNLLELIWVFNFPNGMTGTHTFIGHWIGPCQPVVDSGQYSGPCPKPYAPVDFTHTVTVIFGL